MEKLDRLRFLIQEIHFKFEPNSLTVQRIE
jgi:hypothetical protein